MFVSFFVYFIVYLFYSYIYCKTKHFKWKIFAFVSTLSFLSSHRRLFAAIVLLLSGILNLTMAFIWFIPFSEFVLCYWLLLFVSFKGSIFFLFVILTFSFHFFFLFDFEIFIWSLAICSPTSNILERVKNMSYILILKDHALLAKTRITRKSGFVFLFEWPSSIRFCFMPLLLEAAERKRDIEIWCIFTTHNNSFKK